MLWLSLGSELRYEESDNERKPMNMVRETLDARRLSIAMKAARTAGELLQSFTADLEVEFKGPRDLVTAADVASQDLIVQMIGDK